jgi:diguanylate cyclase (GGDEF)-like protein/PAS domain S-box-containing protein
VFDVRLALERPDGTRRALSTNAAPLEAAPGGPLQVVCSITDITDQRRAESELRHQATLLRGLFELSPMGIALTDFETGAFIDVNDAILRQLGYTRDELLRMTYFDITPEEYHASDQHKRQLLSEGGPYTPHEKENIRKDGSRFPVFLSSTLVVDSNGRKLLWSIVEDITERKAAEAQIIRQAHYDELTGLPNRRLFQERLERALERAKRGRHIGAVAMLDLDHFKTVNDSLGHKAGDLVLIEAAARLRACTRATDTVARFGGDEFLLLLDDITEPADAETITQKVLGALARAFVVDDQRIELGVSIGIFVFDADSTDPDQILRRADHAMYAAKNGGRNQARFFIPPDSDIAIDRRV